MLRFITLVLVVISFGCATKPKAPFQSNKVIKAPDYNQGKYWAALPNRVDEADRAPKGLHDGQGTAKADVFYVHPTLYFGKQGYDQWNAPIDLQKLNDDVDQTALLYQASAFNSAGKIYAPRYRQAHINAYFNKDTLSARKAFEVAYSDVKAAFEHYLKHFNHGRPIIIASHSQGTTHTSRLLKDFFDEKPLQNQLVAAYMIGIPVDLDNYKTLKPCQSPDDIGCMIGWRTWKKGTKPKFLKKEKDYNVLITNPLTWTTNTSYASKFQNHGAVLTNFEDIPTPELVDAQIHESILWSNKPKFKWSFLMRTKNYHKGDINLFYVNIRENAVNRVNQYISKNQ